MNQHNIDYSDYGQSYFEKRDRRDSVNHGPRTKQREGWILLFLHNDLNLMTDYIIELITENC